MFLISSEKPIAQNAMEIILLLLHNILFYFIFKTIFNNEILENVYKYIEFGIVLSDY